MSELPLVSIVIPTLNSAKTLEKCLNSVLNQTYNKIEIIIVDAGSDDKTLIIGEKFGVRIINANIRNMAKQTNIGALNSEGTYVYRLDSDIVLSPMVVEDCVKKCEFKNCDAIATYWGPDPSVSFWAKVRKLEKDCYKYDKDRNVARFYFKPVFDKIGGYNEDIVAGEDYDVQNRLISENYHICFAEFEGIHLGEPESIIQIIKSNYNYGKTVKSFFKNHKYRGVKQMGPIRMPLLKNWKKFVKSPRLSFGFIFYYFIVYTSTTFGIVRSMIWGF
ncbi:MAG: glycosyltransferase [Methanobacterium sp.]|jgi:glycosyltransferase involved in cell wall biosynthesis|nr:glycosyltransferase [Methanobacterium sp.]